MGCNISVGQGKEFIRPDIVDSRSQPLFFDSPFKNNFHFMKHYQQVQLKVLFLRSSKELELARARMKSKNFSIPRTMRAIITSFKFFFNFLTDSSFLTVTSNSSCLKKSRRWKKFLYSFKIQDCTLRLQSLWNDRTSSGKLSVSHSSGNQHPDYCKTWNEPFKIINDANLDIVNNDRCEKLDYFYSNSSFKMTSSKLVCNFMYNQLVKDNKLKQKRRKKILPDFLDH